MPNGDEAFSTSAIDWDYIAQINKEMESYWFVEAGANAIDNLEMIEQFLRMSESPWRWKWVLIATHQALYTFLILALSGTAPSLAVTKPDMAGMAQLLRLRGLSAEEIAQELSVHSRPMSSEQVDRLLKKELKLIDFDEALKRMCSVEQSATESHNSEGNKCLPWSNSRRLVLSQEEGTAIKRLKDQFRNAFEHFQPKLWYIPLDIFPPLLKHILRVIRFVALESNCIQYCGRDQEQRVGSAIKRIQMQLDLLMRDSSVSS